MLGRNILKNWIYAVLCEFCFDSEVVARFFLDNKGSKESISPLSPTMGVILERSRGVGLVYVAVGRRGSNLALRHLAHSVHQWRSHLKHAMPVNRYTLTGHVIANVDYSPLFIMYYDGWSGDLSIDRYCHSISFSIYKLRICAIWVV